MPAHIHPKIPTFDIMMHGAAALLIGIWLASVAYDIPRAARRRYISTSVLALSISIALAEAGKRYMVWPHDPAFPSGHETFASSIAACICLRDRRWLPLCIVTCTALGWALLKLHAHNLIEIAAGIVLGSAVTTAVMRLGHGVAPQVSAISDDARPS